MTDVGLISLSVWDLAVVAVLVVALAGLSLYMRLGVGRQMLIGALRTAVQLALVGLVLKALFDNAHLGWVATVAVFMLAVAAREVMARQERRFRGWRGFGTGALSMFVSAFAVTIFALAVVIGADPWHDPQYAIPLLGMLLGNTMNGVALGLDRLTQLAWQGRGPIEARLSLGYTWREAIGEIRREAMRAGMIPIINAMAVAGVVSLPGMMTGQILAGVAPMEAVKYQILIMFLIAAGTGFGTLVAVAWAAARLFDERQRLRLDRLQAARSW